jgi:signal transduction histidine kinase
LFASGGIPPDAEKEFGNSPLLLSVADGREPVVFNSVRSRSEPEYAILKNAGISAAVAIPLVAKDRSLGMICFATCTRESIAQEESDLLATIAQYLALAVDRENTQNALQIAQAELSQHALILEKRVEDRTSQLKETISELETFSYTLAHDLKAPVRAMRGYCQILLEDFAGVLPARADLIIQKLARAPKRMEALIHDLLEFNEVSRQNIVFCRVDLEAILNDVLSLRTSDVLQAVTIARPLHPVRAHKALLQQVLSNLVDNAVKFVKPMTPPKISIRTEVVARSSPSTREAPLIFSATEPVRATGQTLALETIEGPVRIWVIDEGIGISPEVHQKIFGIFERGMGTEIYEGTGIGLAIVARAMQRMGGTFGVESALGTGSRFWLELPGAATEFE